MTCQDPCPCSICPIAHCKQDNPRGRFTIPSLGSKCHLLRWVRSSVGHRLKAGIVMQKKGLGYPRYRSLRPWSRSGQLKRGSLDSGNGSPVYKQDQREVQVREAIYHNRLVAHIAAMSRTASERRRRRSSSLGPQPEFDSTMYPPVPPLPPNLRSSSATSTTSSHSASSAASASSTRPGGPINTISSMLRRSSSKLSGISSPIAPPSSYPYAAYSETASTSSFSSTGLPLPSGQTGGNERKSPAIPHSSSFSSGYHLPSPSPGSPYNRSASHLVGLGMPTLPHSTSFPVLHTSNASAKAESDTEAEDEDNDRTPRRRKKIRPVSALPPPKLRSQAWEGDGWKGFAQTAPSPAHFIPLTTTSANRTPSSKSTHRPSASEVPNSSIGTTSFTLRRIGSLSKKHGRRLSGGWKFGTGSSSSSTEAKQTTSKLQTVVGSPSKPLQPVEPTVRNDEAIGLAISSQDENEDEEDVRAASRAGSVSAPSSRFRPNDASLVPSASESVVHQKKDTGRRRQSWNDFVIPRDVLEKQKHLKRDIGAVKQFATGVECELIFRFVHQY